MSWSATGLIRKKLYEYIQTIAENEDYALYFRCRAVSILAAAGYNQNSLIRTLEKREDELGVSGYAYLALAMIESGDSSSAEAVWQRMKNLLNITTASIDLEDTFEAAGYFDSEVEQLSLTAMVALRMGENDDFIRRVSESIGRRIQAEQWLAYSDCEAAVIAYAEMLDEESGKDTNFSATVSVADRDLLDEEFRGMSSTPRVKAFAFTDAPFSELEQDKPYTLRFEKKGRGSLFYRSNIEYALPSEIVMPRDEGLSVFTRLETLDGQEVEPGQLVLGQTYRCTAVISSNRDRTLLTLSVPVPSGAEIIDASFASSSSYADEGGVNSEQWVRETVHGDREGFIAEGILNFSYNGWWAHYYRPEMLIFDNEMVYQWEYFYKGERRVSFLFKATSPGIFPTPPAMAELLTEPEVFGRTGGDLFVIQ